MQTTSPGSDPYFGILPKRTTEAVSAFTQRARRTTDDIQNGVIAPQYGDESAVSRAARLADGRINTLRRQESLDNIDRQYEVRGSVLGAFPSPPQQSYALSTDNLSGGSRSIGSIVANPNPSLPRQSASTTDTFLVSPSVNTDYSGNIGDIYDATRGIPAPTPTPTSYKTPQGSFESVRPVNLSTVKRTKSNNRMRFKFQDGSGEGIAPLKSIEYPVPGSGAVISSRRPLEPGSIKLSKSMKNINFKYKDDSSRGRQFIG